MRSPGNTPIIEVDGVFAKLECANPCGSVKDRIAAWILGESLRRGLLRPGMKVVEATSGNTGIALSYYGRELGFPVTIVMPENMTEERKALIRGFGADLVLCTDRGSFAEAAAIRDEIAHNDPRYLNTDQFSNPLNVECHERTTGQEILAQVGARGRRVDAFVAGVGTGGTLIGVGRALRAANPSAHLVAVEPAESAVMSGGPGGPHEIAGIGDGFIPAIAGDGKGGLNPLIDEVIVVSSAEAKEAARYLEEAHGCCVGISSGANFLAACRLRERFPTVATVFPDGFRKYESLGLVHGREGRCPFEHAGPQALFR